MEPTSSTALLCRVMLKRPCSQEHSRDELPTLGDTTYSIWYFLIRYVVPPAVAIIFVMGVSD